MTTEIIAKLLGCWIKLVGMWLFADGLYSLHCYVGNPAHTWLKDHSIRVVRIVMGICLIIWG